MSLAGIPVFREAHVETNPTKTSRQKGLRYLPLRRRFKGKYTFLISYIENLSIVVSIVYVTKIVTEVSWREYITSHHGGLFKYPQAEVTFWIHKSCRGSFKAPFLPVSLTLEIKGAHIPLYYFESFV